MLDARTALCTNRPAAVSIASDSDSCAITSMLPRENKRRCAARHILASIFLEVHPHVGLRELPGREKREDHRAQDAEQQREPQDASVRRGVVDNVYRNQPRHGLNQQRCAPGSDHQSRGAAQNRQQQSFRDQLTHDAPAVAANGQPDRDFLAPRRSLGHHHIRQIQGGDQQHHAGERKQHNRGHVAACCRFCGLVEMPRRESGRTSSVWSLFSAG